MLIFYFFILLHPLKQTLDYEDYGLQMKEQ